MRSNANFPHFADDSIRRMLEAQEEKILAPQACLSKNSQGRKAKEDPCFMRTCFQRDIDRIIHCESFRRLKHKTQVFLSPTNDHFRTRITHTLEVVGAAKSIAHALRLNVDLVEAIGLGHDLGHTPFGHAGEQVLREISETGFHHAAHSVRVVTELEKDGEGLNLSREVIDGILKHSKGRKGPFVLPKGPEAPMTLEGQIVRISDLVAYINHDIDDAISANVIDARDLPKGPIKLLGERNSQRVHNMVKDIIISSQDLDYIRMSPKVWQATEDLRDFLYEKIYPRPEIDGEVEKSKVMLHQMAQWFLAHPQQLLSRISKKKWHAKNIRQLVVDYLAGMTDGFAIRMFKELFVPHERLYTEPVVLKPTPPRTRRN